MGMNRLLLLIFWLLVYGNSWAQNVVKTEKYDAQLELSEAKMLRFKLQMKTRDDTVFIVLKNGNEQVALQPVFWIGDSLDAEHPVYDSYIRLYRDSAGLRGFWHDRSRKGRYILPLNLEKSMDPPILEVMYPKTSRWYCRFDTGLNQYPAIGVFHVSGHMISGTFLTETGDYRYLNGVITPDKYFELGAFDGSHAFYFEGYMKGNNIEGSFYSGNHWKTTFQGVRNDTARLADGFELTKPRQEGPVTLLIRRGDAIVFNLDAPEYANKPVLLQVMGTWCPNCLDETQFLLKTRSRGIPMPATVALCFERGTDTALQLANIERVRKNLNIPYPLILAGRADKKSAAEVLTFMDPVMSYPTTIFLNRKHEVIGIHTGFSGPATGEAYKKQSQTFERMFRLMMNE